MRRMRVHVFAEVALHWLNESVHRIFGESVLGSQVGKLAIFFFGGLLLSKVLIAGIMLEFFVPLQTFL
ncbi:hypothetical protein B4110_3886 [Parageobacillus toebii]|uniref:Uncharacterized protein n=1 Tax=Parageobacillus toebii TaxID=153151 RepID=A0A150M914_9BACL|nr:hypothetical protein B4110_3886 [Parageobacillus toebii]